MHIVSGNLALRASHSLHTSTERTERVELWVRQPRPSRLGGVDVALSDVARRLADEVEDTLDELEEELAHWGPLADCCPAEGLEEDERQMDNLRLLVLAILLETVTGHRFEFIDLDKLEQDPKVLDQLEALEELQHQVRNAPDRQGGWGLRVDVEEVHERHERLRFQASATLRTADGRTLDVDLDVLQERFERSRHRWQLRAGEALQDPLLLDFGTPGSEVADDRLAVDLDGDDDGLEEALPHLGPRSLYLVDDRDSDGQVTDGTELFGPRSGDGYGELRALDRDGNGFVDSADPAWSRLHVWVHRNGRSELVSLSDKGVGALYVGAVEAPFRLVDSQGTRQAQQQAMSFWVGEDGSVGTTRRVDVVT